MHVHIVFGKMLRKDAAEHVGLRSSLSTVYTRMNMGNEMLLMGEVFPSVN